MAWVVQHEEEMSLFSSTFSGRKASTPQTLRVEDDSEMLKVPSDDTDKIKETFYKWDIDGNGIICRHELLGVLRHLCSVTESDLEDLMNEVDTNGDGEIQYEEFIDWLTRPAKSSQGRALFDYAEVLRPVFEAYDVNGTGTIEFEEFEECHCIVRAALKANNRPCRNESDSEDEVEQALDPLLFQREAERAFKAIDENGDKEITFREFVKWLQPAIERSGISNDELTTLTARMAQMLKGVYKQISIAKKAAEAGDDENQEDAEALKLFATNLAKTAEALEGGLKPKNPNAHIGATWTPPPVGLSVPRLKATHAKYYPAKMTRVAAVNFTAIVVPTPLKEQDMAYPEKRMWLGKVIRTVQYKTGKAKKQQPSYYVFDAKGFRWLPLQSEQELKDGSKGAEGANMFLEAFKALADEMALYCLLKTEANFGDQLRWADVLVALDNGRRAGILEQDEVDKFVSYVKLTARETLYAEGIITKKDLEKSIQARVEQFMEASIQSPKGVMAIMTDLGVARRNEEWYPSSEK
eukprot:TRINITY_DN71340_c0_g1_i1.p1 TRINITY_DN71340_c0_g1~~TRINITY_DN71340_c0_g1_i1.p1  ORF type:complete len:524 (-),score=162.50 TRINITY_DN71340_c0_g1_i1:34-1605(-)